MPQLPIRLRLTAVFTALMAAVIAGVGIGSVIHFAAALDETLDQGLEARVHDLATSPPHSGLLPSDRDTLEQIITPTGQVVAGSPGAGTRPVLDPAALSTTRSQPLRVDRDHLDGLPGRARVLAMVSTKGTEVVVVAASLAGRDNALGDLRSELVLALPLVLLAAAGGAYLLTGSALRPVERMRARAAAITAETPTDRLPVPPSRDEIARLGTTLNDMLDRLQTALTHERDFTADASHELRTPLSLLKTELELALSGPRTTTETDTALRSALEETNRLVTLAEDLLLLASTDRSQAVIVEATPLCPLLHTVARRYDGVATAQIQVHCDDHLTAPVDGRQLARAVDNLVDNALRHGAGVITISAASIGDHVMVTIRDLGPGFPPEFLPRAFERFSRPDTARTGGGTGLGLAIVAAIARRHGGSAHATNHPTGGAEVTLTLPTDDKASETNNNVGNGGRDGLRL
jgi:signal transduction histidine kinase